MSIESFKRLSLSERHKLLKKEGVQLAKRYHGSHEINLFQLHNFYVETWTRIGFQQIYWIEVIKEQQQLDNYLDQIKLNL